jgi:hypothetical protein
MKPLIAALLYLSTHHYSFTLDSGFDRRTQDSLVETLKNYRLVLQAEGGSHALEIYERLPMVWLTFLHERFGTTRFFFEVGRGVDILGRRYMETGDTSFPLFRPRFWKLLYDYNHTLPRKEWITEWGVDFERPKSYLAALKFLMPETTPPTSIRTYIDLIKNDTSQKPDCDHILELNKALQKGLKEPALQQYLGNNWQDFKDLIDNPGSCKDVLKNRNGHMAERLTRYAQNETMSYGEFGEAHTVLNSKETMASLINRTPGFEGKVVTVNLYCYQCTASEPVNNWPLRKIEKDILKDLLPYCTGPFTLFDLTGLEGYNKYGPFLIIAKGQH